MILLNQKITTIILILVSIQLHSATCFDRLTSMLQLKQVISTISRSQRSPILLTDERINNYVNQAFESERLKLDIPLINFRERYFAEKVFHETREFIRFHGLFLDPKLRDFYPFVPANKSKIFIDILAYNAVITNRQGFNNKRHYDDYLGAFNDSKFPQTSLSTSLAQLPASAHVLELGAGYLNFTKILSENSHLKVTAIGLESILNKDDFPKLNILDNQNFDKLDVPNFLSQFGKVDLIVDLYGVLSYSYNLPLALDKIIAITRAGSELWIYGPKIKIYDPVKKRTLSFAQYLKLLGCFEVQVLDENTQKMRLIRNFNRPISVPIQLSSLNFAWPPEIVWEMI